MGKTPRIPALMFSHNGESMATLTGGQTPKKQASSERDWTVQPQELNKTTQLGLGIGKLARSVPKA